MLAPTWDFKTGNTWQQNSWAPWASQGAQNLFGSVQNWLQNNPWQNYGGPVSAGFGPEFNQASNFLSGQLGQTNPYTQQGGDAFQSILSSINPNSSISDYMSQYVGAALLPTLDNINQQAAQESQRNNANATMAGAYGGTASGVPCLDRHDAALRPPPRRHEPRRGGKSDDLKQEQPASPLTLQTVARSNTRRKSQRERDHESSMTGRRKGSRKMDSSVSYHPLFVFNQFGDLERCADQVRNTRLRNAE
jgi:hypothetical protein